MTHGAPDDSNVRMGGMMNRLDDLGELAARLGSPVKYHRTGDVLYIDDFEWGLNGWELATTNADGFYQVTNDASLSKGSSLILNSGTGTLFATYARTYLPPCSGDSLGFHFAISMRVNIFLVNMVISLYTGAERVDFIVKYYGALDKATYVTTGGVYPDLVTDLSLAEYDTLFHHFKLVVNQTTGEYVGMYINDVFYSLAGVPGYVRAPAGDPRIEVYLGNSGDATLAAEIAVDDFVLTINE